MRPGGRRPELCPARAGGPRARHTRTLPCPPRGLAAPAPATPVPCDTSALATAIVGATSGEALQLARSCHYVLTAALPVIGQNLTIDGDGATLERSTAPGTPDFSVLQAIAGDLAVNQLNISNGNGGGISFNSSGGPDPSGNLTVTGGDFTGNAGGGINLNQFFPGALSI